MPDVLVFNIPVGTEQKMLLEFYNMIVELVSVPADVERSWVHPLFPKSMLDENPDKLVNTFVIVNELEEKENADEIAEKIVNILGALIQDTFGPNVQAAVKVISQKKEWQHFFEARSDLEGKGETPSMPKPE